eukprot:SAG31_NODE_257_length_18942_cov_6.099135_12_plen_334_part_00
MQLIFSHSERTFSFFPNELRLEVAHAEDGVVERLKHLTVQHGQLIIAQSQADEDHDMRLEKLAQLDEKMLKMKLKKLGLSTTVKKKLDPRLSSDGSKRAWRERVLCDRLIAIADNEKAAADKVRDAEIEEISKQRADAAHEFEHVSHVKQVGLEEARILHADQMHQEVIRHHEAHIAKKLKTNKKLSRSQLLRQAEKRGIEVQSVDGRKVKKSDAAQAVLIYEQGVAEKAASHHVGQLDLAKKSKEEQESKYSEFATTHGLEMMHHTDLSKADEQSGDETSETEADETFENEKGNGEGKKGRFRRRKKKKGSVDEEVVNPAFHYDDDDTEAET